jgi:hypothetical protein
MRTLLRFDPLLPRAEVCLAPVLPPGFGSFRADNVQMDHSRITLSATGSEGSIDGLPQGTTVLHEPRPPLERLIAP